VTQPFDMPQRPAPLWAKVLVVVAMFTTVIFVGSIVVYGIMYYYAKLKGVNF